MRTEALAVAAAGATALGLASGVCGSPLLLWAWYLQMASSDSGHHGLFLGAARGPWRDGAGAGESGEGDPGKEERGSARALSPRAPSRAGAAVEREFSGRARCGSRERL